MLAREPEIGNNPESQIGPFLGRKGADEAGKPREARHLFAKGDPSFEWHRGIHTVKPLEVRIPKGRLTVVTGVSGSGKTTMVLESLVPALEAMTEGKALPEHIRDG